MPINAQFFAQLLQKFNGPLQNSEVIKPIFTTFLHDVDPFILR